MRNTGLIAGGVAVVLAILVGAYFLFFRHGDDDPHPEIGAASGPEIGREGSQGLCLPVPRRRGAARYGVHPAVRPG